jgi:hypothetical protein
MSLIRELSALAFDVNVYSTEQAFLWDPQWHSCTGVPNIDLTMDVRNVILGGGAAISLKPALQFASVRTERPDDGALITAGSAITTNNLVHFRETVSGGSRFFFRRGVGFKLTAASFARAQGVLYSAFPTFGTLLGAEEIVFNPTNDTNAVSYFPLGGGRAIPTAGVTNAKLVVFGMGNLTTTMDWRLAGRAFSDPLARGAWTDLGAGWNTPQTTDFETPTNDIPISGLSPASFQWFELALAVRKTQGGDTNSRCVFRVLPALSYL